MPKVHCWNSGFNEIEVLKDKPSFLSCMKWYESPKCIHLTFVSYDHKSSKSLDLVSIWSFDEFPNLCLRFFTIQTISHLTMVCYHQNLIMRTLGLTISHFFMMSNLGYLGEEKKSPPSNQSWINQSIFNRKQCKAWKFE